MKALRGLIALLPCFLAANGAMAQEVTAGFLAASDKSFSRPHDLVLSPDGGRIYVAIRATTACSRSTPRSQRSNPSAAENSASTSRSIST